jgi:hypothetical protein
MMQSGREEVVEREGAAKGKEFKLKKQVEFNATHILFSLEKMTAAEQK